MSIRPLPQGASSPLYVFLFLFCGIQISNAQIGRKSFNYTTEIGFVENRNPDGSLSEEKPFRTEVNGLKVYFTQAGLRYHVNGWRKGGEKHEEHGQVEDYEDYEPSNFTKEFHVSFINPSAEISVEATGLKKNYVIEHLNVKEQCFEKITYKNVWPRIDIEFVIPEKGGIKYNINLQPGANIKDIQLDYSEAEDLILTNGNLQVVTALGKWTEYAPISFTESGRSLKSSYLLSGSIIGFKVETEEITEPVIIDPWIALVPAITDYGDLPDPADSLWNGPIGYDLIGTGLDNAYNRVQLDYDALGNIYLSQIACLYFESPDGFDDYYAVGRYIHKYNSEGELLFTVDHGFEFAICTDITVNKTSQNFYSSSLFSNLMYMTADGTTTDVFPIDELPQNVLELISMQYDHCQDKLILGLGGDNDELGSFIATTGPSFTGELDFSFAYDLSLSAPNALPFNDNIDVIIDPYSGDYYMLFLLRTQSGFQEDRAILRTDPVNVDPVWQTNGEFLYLVELALHSVGIIQGNLGRMHYEALACGKNSVYGMNGSELLQWAKSDGSILNQIEIYPFFQNLGRAEGIDVDICGNVYLGAANEIQVFDSLLNPLLTIPLAGMPQDIHVFGNKLYVAEDFNIESIDLPETLSPWQFTEEPDSCGLCVGQASIEFCIQPELLENISVEWQSNGDVGFSTDGLCAGWNRVKIFETKGCYTNEYVDSVFVTNNASNFCPIQVNIDDQTLCEGSCTIISAQVTGSEAEPFTYIWSDGSSGSASEIEVCPDVSTTYTVTVEDANGQTVSASSTISVIPIPQVALGQDTTLCEPVSIELDAGNEGGIYLWQDGSTNQNYVVSNEGEYWVDVIVDGCLGSDTINVVYSSLNVNLGNDTTVCGFENIILDAGEEAAEFLWQDGSIGQFYSPEAEGTYFVTASDGFCTSSDSISIAFSEITASFEFTSSVLCELAPIEFFDLSISSTNGQITWLWDFGDGSFSGNQNPQHVYSSPGTYSVSLLVSDIFGCQDIFSENIQVQTLPSPEAFFTVLPPTPIPLETVEFIDASTDAISWNWNLGDGTLSESQNVIHAYQSPGEYPVQLIVQNEFCSDSITLRLLVSEELLFYVPNSFTPNGDGINDVFGPVISGNDLSDFEMLIFNRWGELIFKTTNPNEKWTGANTESNLPRASEYYVPNGIYIWQISVKENFSSEKKLVFGSVALIR